LRSLRILREPAHGFACSFQATAPLLEDARTDIEKALTVAFPAYTLEQLAPYRQIWAAEVLRVRDSARAYMAEQHVKHQHTLNVFFLARNWDPSHGAIPTVATLRADIGMAALPKDWLPEADVNALVNELPVLATQLSNHMRVGSIKNVLFWYRDRENILPTWARYAPKLALLKPASAGIERVWSVFTRFFEDADIEAALMDYIESVLTRKYNHRSDEHDSAVPLEVDVPPAIGAED